MKSSEGLYGGEGPSRPPNGRQAPVARWGEGATGPLHFFLPRDLLANLKKKLHLGPVAL